MPGSCRLMAACVLCRRAGRFCYLPGLRKDFIKAKHVCVKQEDETDDREGKKGDSQHQEASLPGQYRLYYNPTSYRQPVWNSATPQSKTDNDEDEPSHSTLAPSFWQQCSRYSVSSSRHLSSSKNTLVDFAFNKSPESKMHPNNPKKAVTPDVIIDPRAFHKCRPEYASMTLDLNQRPEPIAWEEALLLLQKVGDLKGSMTPSDVSRFLGELSRAHSDKMSLVRSDHRFIMLLRYSVEHLRLFTELQLLEVLQSFVWLDMPPSHTVLQLYESELSARAKQMSLHQLLLAADMWRCIKKEVPQFLQQLYHSVRLYLGQLGVPELVQLLYIMGEGRHCPARLINPIEKLLVRHLEQLYPEEVGVIFLGLFKSQTTISEALVTRIVNNALSFVEEMSDFSMVNVLKYMRFRYLYHWTWMEAMTREVPRRAPRMGVKGLMHVALTCSALHYHNDDILMAIAERVPPLVPQCRSKDTCKLLWAFGTVGFPPSQSPSFYSSLIEDLRQTKVEFQRYPEHLLTGLLGLAFVSQFPEDLIALALSPDFVNLAVKRTKLDLKKDLYTLDGVVALELPRWTGPRLSRELREEVAQMLWKFAQSDVCQKTEVLEAEYLLRDLLGGEKFVRKRMILPHTRSIDLEVHLDPTGKPIAVNPPPCTDALSPEDSNVPSHKGWERKNFGVTITEDLLEQLINTKITPEPLTPPPAAKPPSSSSRHHVAGEHGSLFDTRLDLTTDLMEALTKPSNQGAALQDSKGTVKLAIQVTSRNHYCCHSQRLLGLHAMKRRQLKLAGYKVVELSYHEWVPMLKKSRFEKQTFLHNKVYSSQK